MEVSSTENHWFLWSIFQQAMFDYRRVAMYDDAHSYCKWMKMVHLELIYRT